MNVKSLDLETYSDEIGRLYKTPVGDFYSVTTMLSKSKDEDSKLGLNAWKEKVGSVQAKKVCENACRDGELFHLACEKIINEGCMPVDLETQVQMNFTVNSVIDKTRTLFKKINKVIGLELPLYSEKLQLAGRVDGVVHWNTNNESKLSIIDHKLLSRVYHDRPEYYEDYFIQCTCYSWMFYEQHKQLPDKIVLLLTPKDGGIPITMEKDRKDYDQKMIDRIRKFREYTKESNKCEHINLTSTL